MPGEERVRPPRWLKPLNKVLIFMLRLGLPVSRVESPVVLTVPGRKTGKLHSTPVTPMDVDGKRYVVNAYPGADWVNNVRAAGRVTLTTGRRTDRVRMVELSPDEAHPVLRAFPAAVPIGVDLMKRVGLLTDGTPDEVEGLAGRCPVFRVDPSRSVAGMSNTERIRPPWWLKYVNKVMIGIQKLGVDFGGKGPVILTVPGRKSGRPRSTPITPMTVDGKRYVLGGLPGSDWAANARAAGEATLRQGRSSERVRVVELPAEDARPLLREFPVAVPSGVGFLKNAGLVTGPNPDEYEALAGRCPVFRFEPINA
jgi:deazaflavin-dependent oxidoreductase (nitroreductase family)